MTDSHFSQNPWNSADIIRGYKPDFTPRVAFILGSGLGALAEQIEDAVAISYEKLPGLPNPAPAHACDTRIQQELSSLLL